MAFVTLIRGKLSRSLFSIVLLFIIFTRVATAVEVGFYSSGWTKWGLENLTWPSVYIYQSKFPPDQDVIRSISAEACKLDVAIIFRQEVDKGKFKRKRQDDVLDTVVNAIVEGYSGVSCSGHSLSIDEENIYWNGRSDELSYIYRNIKKSVLKVPVMQWYSSHKKNNAPGLMNWPLLPSDGWIFDQYSMSQDIYEEFLGTMTELHDNLNSIVWLSPNWEIGIRKKRYINESYWNLYGRERFLGHVNSNIDKGIPTLFFFYYLGDNGKVTPWFKELESNQPALKFYKQLKESVFPKIQSDILLELSDIPKW